MISQWGNGYNYQPIKPLNNDNLKLLYIHNNYASNNSGEEHAAEGIVNLLKQNGHIVEWYRRSSEGLSSSLRKKISASMSGIYNPSAVMEVKQMLLEFRPDVVQIQNLYPLISPAIIKTIKASDIPIVMRCPNYRLFCPTGLHLDNKNKVCEKCLTTGREIHCILKNCENDIFKSIAYAARNYAARTWWDIFNHVDVFIVQSEFQKQKFIDNGIPDHKIAIVPGLTPEINISRKQGEPKLVTFVGRVSAEKGIIEFVEAARQLPEVPFSVAGTIDPSMSMLKETSPKNIKWFGFLRGQQLDDLYQQSRIIVCPSKWFEGFPNVIVRAMKHGKPVITSNLGAMASIIDHKKNGLLVESGNADNLAEAVSQLYFSPDTCNKYGENGRKKSEEVYSSKQIYLKLMNIYSSLIKI